MVAGSLWRTILFAIYGQCGRKGTTEFLKEFLHRWKGLRLLGFLLVIRKDFKDLCVDDILFNWVVCLFSSVVRGGLL